jgi:hypothetical protein
MVLSNPSKSSLMKYETVVSAIRQSQLWVDNPGGLILRVNRLLMKTGALEIIAAAKDIQQRSLVQSNWKEAPEPQLQQDARIVFSHLCLDWDRLRNEKGLLPQLLRVCFVPVKRSYPSCPRFRMTRMQSLANRRLFNCFHELKLPAYVDVCWSQVSRRFGIREGRA